MMSTILATNNNFPVHGPALLKKGETGIFFFFDKPEYDTANTVSYVCEIRLPDGRRVSPDIKDSAFTMTGGISLSGKKILFTPTAFGTHIIAIQFYNATTLTSQSSLLAFHVPEWLENMDRPISEMLKLNTQVSRLRTQFDRSKNNGS